MGSYYCKSMNKMVQKNKNIGMENVILRSSVNTVNCHTVAVKPGVIAVLIGKTSCSQENT